MADLKPEDTTYPIPENAQYDPTIRKLKVSDPAQAETVFNPLFQQIINNTHAVKLSDDTKAQKDLTNVNDTSVLEKVKKVDGSGSGLDADTLDGKHAEEFAPGGFGLGTSCINLPQSADLNDLPEKYKNATGFFMGSALKNQPTELGSSWIYLLQMIHYTTHKLQIAFTLNGAKAEWGNIFIRQCINNVWNDWKKPDASTIAGKEIAYLLDYNNLTNKPVIPTTLPANGGNADTVGGKNVADLQNYNNLTSKPVLKTVATSGNYNDLTNKPTIPTTLPASGGNADTVDGKHAVDLQNYNNLTNKPVIPTTLPANGGNADTVGGKSARDLLDYNNLTNKLIVNNQVGANASSYDKVDFDGCNIDIISWYGLGIFSPSQNPEKIRSIIINARNGDIKTKGKLETEKQILCGENVSCIADVGMSCGYQTTAHRYDKGGSQWGAVPSFAFGEATIANMYQFVIGRANVDKRDVVCNASTNGYVTEGSAFIIGNGSYTILDKVKATSNCFRVQYDGKVFAKGSYSATGADYAELFEWEDGNESTQDRRGLFVALKGTKIHIADSKDKNIIGIISSKPTMIGNNPSETWKDMYLNDMWGELISDEKTKAPILNPKYNPDEEYIPRHERKEWGVVGMLGQLIVQDDGSCEVDSYCTYTNKGIATTANSGYYVMERIASNYIRILFK